MKVFRAVTFLLAIAVALGGAEYGARAAIEYSDAPVLRWHDFSSQFKAEQMEGMADTELVIVGTSMAQQDLVPRVLAAQVGDVGVYNAGLNGGVPVVMEPWLEGQVLPALNPDIVVWGLSPLDVSAVYGDATKNAYDQAFETRAGILAETDRWASRYSTLIASRAVLRSPTGIRGDEAAIRADQAQDARESLGDAGERVVFDVELGIDRQTEVTDRVTPFTLDRDDLAAIVRTVEDLRTRGIEVVFVELPTPARLASLMPNKENDLQLFRRAVMALGKELDVAVLSASDTYSDSDFVDFTHMSESAAARFSSDIGRQIAAL